MFIIMRISVIYVDMGYNIYDCVYLYNVCIYIECEINIYISILFYICVYVG